MRTRIEGDLKGSLKSGDKRRVSTLRLLLAALQNEKIQAQRELTEEEVEATIRRSVKQRKDSIEQYARGGREDLAEAERQELAILESYLPKALSAEELEAAIRELIEEKGLSSPKQIGLLMKELMGRNRGRVDGRQAQEIASRLLSNRQAAGSPR